MKRAALSLVFAALALPGVAAAQQSIDPGMSRAQVEERFGKPSAVRTSGDHTYLFFKNGCAKTCGIDDLVVLEHGVVKDAVLRSADRAFSGTSTSPRAVPADVAARTGRDASQRPAPEVTQAGAPAGAPVAPPAAPAAAARQPNESHPAAPSPASDDRAANRAPAPAGPAITQPNRAPLPAADANGRIRIKVRPQHAGDSTSHSLE